MDDTHIINVEEPRRRYGAAGRHGFDAVRGVSFSVRGGELHELTEGDPVVPACRLQQRPLPRRTHQPCLAHIGCPEPAAGDRPRQRVTRRSW
jgi:hypothetical protein